MEVPGYKECIVVAKLKILKEVSENSVKATLDKHGIYPATYYS